MIWFLTFGKNGSAGMPAVPATILMSEAQVCCLRVKKKLNINTSFRLIQ